ncbi:glycosyltransferase [Methylorubrum thiocyanatum]|uniref:glycosyltransferase n=1 Tax=Methylorubrum thiocyanatum TaxID=47958 RepID=UPI00383ADF6E
MNCAQQGKHLKSVSLVICTLNRSEQLKKCLMSLEQQNYPLFEVVVVNGPSTDSTLEVLENYKYKIISLNVREANLSKSRNAGINASSGDLIIFLDDDAFPEPDWITNIVYGYDDERVGGVGTRVYDHTGFKWQMNPFLVDKFYNGIHNISPPLWAFEYHNSVTIPHILGASSSFRRDVLKSVGGFDEEIEYFLDESEICRRISEAGYIIRFMDAGASVHHQFAPGVTRDDRRLLTHPYPVVKNKFYVCFSDWKRNGGSLVDYVDQCESWVRNLQDDALWQLDNGKITKEEYDKFTYDVRRGKCDGQERALQQHRKSALIVDAQPEKLLRFPTNNPIGGRKTICFISRWTPRRSPGGIARYIWDLASGFAHRGHETHLITMTDGPSHVEFHEGLWIRHVNVKEQISFNQDEFGLDVMSQLKSEAARNNIEWSKAAHAEILRLRLDRYIDFVIAPVWDQEGLYCAIDKRLRTIISMNTTFRRFASIEFQNLSRETVSEVTTLENLYIRSSNLFHANSKSSAQHLQYDFCVGKSSKIFVVPHGVRDIPNKNSPAADVLVDGLPDDVVRILYVSRLEKRKGTDIFLEAVVKLLSKHSNIRVDIIGRDPHISEPERSFKVQFESRYPEQSNIVFHGEISDDKIIPFYNNADIFCVPSRYESFGIIFIEAMRYRLPVVTLNVGGASDIVQDGLTGLLCPDANSSILCSALERLYCDPSLRRQMGEAARNRFLDMYENDVVIDHMITALRAISDVDASEL